MSKEVIGDACAFIKGTGGEKNKYPRIGLALKDDDGRISIKIDTIPLPGTGWEGWVNIFPKDGDSKPRVARPSTFSDDDIPF